MERDFRKKVEKGFRYGLGGLLGIGTVIAIFNGNIFLSAAEAIGAWVVWPKKEKGSASHTVSSTGHLRAFESSSSLARISKADAALQKVA